MPVPVPTAVDEPAGEHTKGFLHELPILIVIAGVAYVAHSIISLLLDGPRIILYERATMLARAAGEFPIMLWLLIRGADARRAGSTA